MPSEDAKVNNSGSALHGPGATAIHPPASDDSDSVDVVLDFDAAPEASPASAPNPPTAGQEGGKDASSPADHPDGCRCALGRRLSATQLAQLDGALLGTDGEVAQGFTKLSRRFDVPRGTIVDHKYKCLGERPGKRVVARDLPATDKRVNKLARASAKLAESRDQRVAFLARRLALGREAGLLTYATLSDTWGISLNEVRELADAAHLMYQACRGDTSHERRRSVAFHDDVKKKATRVYKQAMKGVVAKIDPDGEPVHLVDLKAAATAIGVAAKAQVAQDKATGVAAGGTLGAMFRTPEFQGLLGVILGALTEDARIKVLGAVKRELDAKRAGASFDDALRLLEMSGDSPDSA